MKTGMRHFFALSLKILSLLEKRLCEQQSLEKKLEFDRFLTDVFVLVLRSNENIVVTFGTAEHADQNEETYHFNDRNDTDTQP